MAKIEVTADRFRSSSPHHPIERFRRLETGSTCRAPWDGMEGDFRERFCARCARTVHDFSRLTAREIEARIQAHRGGLCARITRDGEGLLVHLHGSEIAESNALPSIVGPRRASPAAALVVGAFLGAAVTPARPAAADEAVADVRRPSESGDRSPGESAPVVESGGTFVVDGLEAGAEEGVEGGAEAGVTMGAMVEVPDPIRVAFANASLAFFAVVGETEWPNDEAAEEEYAEVETELAVLLAVKGEPPATLRLRTWAFLRGIDESESGVLPLGSTVLLFLPESDEALAEVAGAGSTPVFDAGAALHGPRILGREEEEVFRERLEALARIDAEERPDPADLTEWLVATVAEPYSRADAVADLRVSVERTRRVEAGSADENPDVESLDERAEGSGALTPDQRQRLLEALRATESLTTADLELFELVGGWAPAESSAWLRETARAVTRRGAERNGGSSDFWLWRRVADLLNDEALERLVEVEEERAQTVWERYGSEALDEPSEIQEVTYEMTRRLLRAIDRHFDAYDAIR